RQSRTKNLPRADGPVMPLRFPYLQRPTRRPVPPLGGVRFRHFPIFPIVVSRTGAAVIRDGLLDTGASDTVCDDRLAQSLGIDLTNTPDGEARGAGGHVMTLRYATVSLRITDQRETCVWDALVGFAPLGSNEVLL